jgi:hypothetical protein
MEALHTLRLAADAAVGGYAGKRRPTWAPALVIGGEFLSTLEALGDIETGDKPVARLWARYTDPTRGPVTCRGFELRPGTERKGYAIYETMLGRDGTWSNGPVWLPPKALPRFLVDDQAAIARRERQRERYDLRCRATELGAQRVLEFAGDASEQMRLGGVLTGACNMCGRGLTDPISLERGIGPECWSHAQHLHRMFDAGREAAAE